MTGTRLATALDHHRAGRLDRAERLYRALLADDPGNADALHLCGVAAHQRGRHREAVDLIAKAIAVNGRAPDFHNNIGEAYRALGDLDKAIASYRTALALDAAYADAFNNLGLALQARDALDAASEAFRQAIRARPGHAKAHNNLAVLLKNRGEAEEAIDHYRRALAADPNYADAHSNLGNVLSSQGRRDEAFRHYRRALEIDPDNAEAMVNLGTALKEAGQTGESDRCYRRAIAARPDYAEAHYNLGVNLADVGDIDEAIACYRRAIAQAPDHVKAHKNLSVALLLRGAFAEGFDEWEWRWREPDTWKRTLDLPVWDGGPLAGKKLLVWGEQGVGDEIMLASLFREMIAEAEQLRVECDARLVPLLARSFPEADLVARADPPDPALSDPTLDRQCAAGGLCRWRRRDAAAFAAPEAFLIPDPARVAEIRARYRALGPGAKIGIAWRSKPRRGTVENIRFKAAKSTKLESWWPVLMQEGARFINLQYGDCADELAALKSRYGVEIIDDGAVDQMASLDDFAAQVAALDLVITSSNTTAHMAGALGRKVWTLVAHLPDWRWQLGREDTLWYPNMRLYRQSAPGDWAGVMARVGSELAKEIGTLGGGR